MASERIFCLAVTSSARSQSSVTGTENANLCGAAAPLCSRELPGARWDTENLRCYTCEGDLALFVPALVATPFVHGFPRFDK